MWTYLWQNFLIDAKVRNYIADKISALYHELWCETLIEIWPGKGSITKLIHTISDHFFVVDKDPTFYDNWQLTIENWKFILGDVLEVDVKEMLNEKNLPAGRQGLHPSQTLVVGNLPYYITSPILRKFFGYGQQEFAGGIFMVQEEVGQRLKSDAKKKSYLRRLLNYAYEVKYLKWVPAKCFKPVPKVKSCLIELKIKNWELKIERDRLIEFLELFAPFSRKTLGAISKMLDKRFIIKTPCDRDKQLSIDTCPFGGKMINFVIPESLQKKRLEELTRDDLAIILSKNP